MDVTKSSNVSDPEIIQHSKLHKYVNEDLFVTITSIFKYAKLALWLKGGGDDEPKLSTVACISSMAPAYSAALQQMGIAQNTPAHISDFDTAPCPSDTFNRNWVIYPGKTRFYLSTDIMRDLQKLYILVKGKKKSIKLLQRRHILFWWI